MELFGDVERFLKDNTDIAPATRKKLLTYFENIEKKQHLLLEIAIVVDVGVHFVKATYILEGDGALALSCYDTITTVITTVNQASYPNTQAIVKILSAELLIQKQLLDYAIECVNPGINYFQTCLSNCMAEPLKAFKAIRLFNPSKVQEMQPTSQDIYQLSSLPFLAPVVAQLQEELPAYMAASQDTDPSKVKEFWLNHKDKVPTWFRAHRKILLVQPSSAASERVFSILNNTFKSQQQLCLQDLVETSTMLQYNR